jgi:hypothetical protein
MEDYVAVMQSLQQKPASVSINLRTSQLMAMLVALLNSKHKTSILYRKNSVFCLLPALLLGLFFSPEDGGDMFVRNVS